jgi:hypothetical protein
MKISRQFVFEAKPILRIGIKSILRIDTDGRAALASQFSKT